LFREAAIDRQARKNLGLDKPGASAQFFKRGGQAKLTAERERLRAEGFAAETPKTPKLPDLTTPALLAGTAAAGGGKTPAEEAAEAKQKQLEAAKEMLTSLKQESQILTATTEKERERLQLDFDKLNLASQFDLLTDKELQGLRDQLEIKFGLSQADKARIEAAKLLKAEQDKQLAQVKEIADVIQNGITGAIMGAIDSSKTLSQSLSGILKQLGGILLNRGIGGFAVGGKGGSGLLGLLPGFANGGRPPVGRPSIVGERGPELFVPRSSGTIVPNHAIGGATSVVVNVDATGSAAQGNDAQAGQLGRVIGAAVQAELIKQKRPGGLLTR